MEINNNGYSKNIIINIKKEDAIQYKASISTYKNNELQVILNNIQDVYKNELFDANIDIIIKFNFNKINEDFFWLLLLLHWLKKYKIKSLNLILPYFPYTTKDLFLGIWNTQEKNTLKISTDNSVLQMLEGSGITSIKVFDIWNLYIQNYSNIYVQNIKKNDIFINEFDFFKKTTKRIHIIALNQDDYVLLKKEIWHKDNINILYLDEDISLKTKNDQISLLSKLKDNTNKSIIYIFDKIIIRWGKIYTLANLISKNLDVKELNLCITHWIFAYWTHNKFNTLIERYPFINIITTDSLFAYNKKLNDINTEIIKLNLLDKK